ncbi:MAG: hypothetical protein ACR5LD_08295 [Symbiopectobacterium sp.]
MRWSEQSQAIATPNFITHFHQQRLVDDEVTLWRQEEKGAINAAYSSCTVATYQR